MHSQIEKVSTYKFFISNERYVQMYLILLPKVFPIPTPQHIIPTEFGVVIV